MYNLTDLTRVGRYSQWVGTAIIATIQEKHAASSSLVITCGWIASALHRFLCSAADLMHVGMALKLPVFNIMSHVGWSYSPGDL